MKIFYFLKVVESWDNTTEQHSRQSKKSRDDVLDKKIPPSDSTVPNPLAEEDLKAMFGREYLFS